MTTNVNLICLLDPIKVNTVYLYICKKKQKKKQVSKSTNLG